MALTPADLALHEGLGITPAILERMQVRRVSDPEAREVLAMNGHAGRMDGILYTYLDPATGDRWTYRLRRDVPEFERGKPKNKYLSAHTTHRHLYFVGDAAALFGDTAVVVIIGESEKGALAAYCAAAARDRVVLAIGLGGCFGWRGRIGKIELANGGHGDELGPLPDFDRITWTDRAVVLIFDTNAATNAEVQRSRRQLGIELSRRGAKVRVVTLPQEDGINGPDDFLGRHGPDPFFALVDGAPDAATVDVIFRLNQRHAVVREGGKTLVVTEEIDPVLARRVVTRSSFADFRNFYLRESVTIEPNRAVSLGQYWLTHRDRRQYEGVVMMPNRVVPNYLNLWRGFAVTPAPGSCAVFKSHVYDVICGGNDTVFGYVWSWFADAVQHPERSADTALVFRGGRGVGKGITVRTFGDLFGQHYLQIANTKHLTGNFNAHLQDAIVLFADEAFYAGDKAGESVLKMLITEPVIPIERKGRDVILAKNLLHIIMASNHEWVVPAGVDERRFLVLDVDPGHQNDHDYFAALQRELDGGGRAALLYDLLHQPIERNLRDVPETEALREQKVLSLAPNERWLFDKLMAGRWLPEHDDWQTSVSKDHLHENYVVSLQRLGVERRRTETELGMFLTKILPTAQSKRVWIDEPPRRVWVWIYPDLKTCRSAFDKATRSQHPWPKDT
jgi:Family of unknown function (DUF5906)/Domain of unknown function (DUF3854)